MPYTSRACDRDMQTESVYGILSLLPCLLGILLLASEAAGRNSQSQLRQEARLRGISDFRNDSSQAHLNQLGALQGGREEVQRVDGNEVHALGQVCGTEIGKAQFQRQRFAHKPTCPALTLIDFSACLHRSPVHLLPGISLRL